MFDKGVSRSHTLWLSSSSPSGHARDHDDTDINYALFKPNLTPPITTTDQALAYKAELERIEPNVQFLMTLYLSGELTPQEIIKAKQAGIVGLHLFTGILLLSHDLPFSTRSGKASNRILEV
jgi:hypothetical protein